jgi:hypothetical protein
MRRADGVVSLRPGMGGANATRSVAAGASNVVWLASEAPYLQTGRFWRDRKVVPW